MDDTKIKVRILPLHNIGGVGMAGDVVWMSAADAEMYIREGDVEVVDADPAAPNALQTLPPNDEVQERHLVEEGHVIMKPQSRRRK